ncbi:hypothetical protein BH11PLA1_BH11PLA1_21560 [soil metagenome]
MTTALLLAWRPFLDPIDADHWYAALLIPLALGIAVAYKAVRMKDLTGYPRQVVMFTIQTIFGMIALAAAFYALAEIYVVWRMG